MLLLVSAGNSWDGKRDFLANHQDVILIYASNSKGEFLGLTLTQTSKGLEKLGTYGIDIPPYITEEVSVLFPKTDLSAGTSIATAIVVGIVTITLSYIAALPSMLKVMGFEYLFSNLYTKKGWSRCYIPCRYRLIIINNSLVRYGSRDKNKTIGISLYLYVLLLRE